MIDCNFGMLTVVVKDKTWMAYGDGTPSSEEAFNVLVSQGGIADTVPEGTYTYTIERVDDNTMLANLRPKEEAL